MFLRKLALALCVLFLAAPMVRAQEAPPALLIQARSLDAFRDDINLLVGLAGRQELGQQVDSLIKGKTGDTSLAGVNTTKPLGAYARVGPQMDDLTGVLLVPVADEKAFLGLLDNLGLTTTKGKDDIYSVGVGLPVGVFLRFANSYAYITAPSPKAIEASVKLLDPAKILGDKAGPAIAMTIRLDQVPEAAKTLALSQLEQELQAIQGAPRPEESANLRELRKTMLDSLGIWAKQILTQGNEINVALDIDRAAKDLSFRVGLTGKPNTELAKTIADLSRKQSLFTGLHTKDAAMFTQATCVLPEGIQKALSGVLDDVRGKLLTEIPQEESRKLALKLFDILAPTVKSGDVDTAVALYGSAAPYTLLAMAKVKDGVAMGKDLKATLIEQIKSLPADKQALFQLDAATAGNFPIHKIAVTLDADKAKEVNAIIGESTVYIAFRDDAVFAAVGKDGMSVLKRALDMKATGAAPLYYYEADLSKILDLLANNLADKKAVQESFAPGQSNQARTVLEAGSALTLRINIPLSFVTYANKLAGP